MLLFLVKGKLMNSFLNGVLKLLGILVLTGVAPGILLVAVALFSLGSHQAAKTAKQARKNAVIEVLRMYASPPNRTLAWRFYLVTNTSGKTITALKFRVTVYNKLTSAADLCAVVQRT